MRKTRKIESDLNIFNINNSMANLLDTNTRRSINNHIRTALATMDAIHDGSKAKMSADEVDDGMDAFDNAYGTLCAEKKKKESDILTTLEDMRLKDIRRFNLWGLSITHDIPANMPMLLSMAHTPYTAEDEPNIAIALIGSYAETINLINEQLTTLQRLRDFYSDTAIVAMLG